MKTTKESILDIVYGVHAVTESLEANTGNKLYIQDDLRGKNVDAIKALAAEKKVSISWTPKKTLSDMTGGAVHQGFVLRVSEFAYSDLSVIMDKAEQEENPLILILDGLNDPHNFGSILRTADATQVTGVIIPKHRAVGVTPVVAKTSTGAVEHIPIARVTNLSQTLDKLKEAGFWVFGTDMDGTASHKWNTAGKLALIIGNEGKGISANIKKQVDEMITIPKPVNSLRPISLTKLVKHCFVSLIIMPTLSILISSVCLMPSLFQGIVSAMISTVSVLFLLRKTRQLIAILSAQQPR